MNAHEVPPGVSEEPSRGDDSLQGEFLPTPCAEQVAWLQRKRLEQAERIAELTEQNRTLRNRLGKCHSSRSRLRTASEVAIRESVEGVNRAIAELEGERLATNAPSYPDAEDTTS